ncbi:winged helix-turn-helix domain-containing protein [Falsirhodobacter halotolerans]|uniref:winged helix-turn-helix domain-containing protein n=1 Tax=Falsirhodobacter halotolerans TaxID=1146892 RepID=UPI001FD4D622|nr:LysR family transcriptional regulator [Falsirhodobacter halotolerans]MCJ8140474.1 LysR family transcriptional regulator [Falsirhodobacter halotolerans]
MSGVDIYVRLQFPTLRFGPGKADLLTAIRDHGSISAAGRAMGMSYRRAWALVEEMNTAFAAPLVSASRGGAGRGGAELTPDGVAVLDAYRRAVAHAAEADISAIARRLR